MVELVPMSEPEFRRYMETAVADYAQHHIKAGDCDPEDALALAQADYDPLLPEGLHSPGQHLFSIHADSLEGPISLLWFEMRERRGKKSAFIYDIRVDDGQRGKGYGRETLAKAEALAASMGALRISLNVMGWNHTARGLYEKAGFTITEAMHMAALANLAHPASPAFVRENQASARAGRCRRPHGSGRPISSFA